MISPRLAPATSASSPLCPYTCPASLCLCRVCSHSTECSTSSLASSASLPNGRHVYRCSVPCPSTTINSRCTCASRSAQIESSSGLRAQAATTAAMHTCSTSSPRCSPSAPFKSPTPRPPHHSESAFARIQKSIKRARRRAQKLRRVGRRTAKHMARSAAMFCANAIAEQRGRRHSNLSELNHAGEPRQV